MSLLARFTEKSNPSQGGDPRQTIECAAIMPRCSGLAPEHLDLTPLLHWLPPACCIVVLVDGEHLAVEDMPFEAVGGRAGCHPAKSA
jgi:hypothetical protein